MQIKIFDANGMERMSFVVPPSDRDSFNVDEHGGEGKTAKVSSETAKEILVDGSLHTLDVTNVPTFDAATHFAYLTGYELKADGNSYQATWSVVEKPVDDPAPE